MANLAYRLDRCGWIWQRGKSTLLLEGVTVNMPLIIEVVDEQLKLEPPLPEPKRIVDERGLATIQVAYVL